MVVITCKTEEVLIKNEGASVHNITHHFPNSQGQITPESVMVYDQNSNSPQRSCMPSLPARMKMIQSKIKRLEW